MKNLIKSLSALLIALVCGLAASQERLPRWGENVIVDIPRAPVTPPGPDGLGGLTNGDFETGDLSGWTQVNVGTFQWFNYTGTVGPVSGRPINAPPQGARAALADQNGPETSILYQDVTVPAIGSTEFRAIIFYQNDHFEFVDAGTGTLNNSAGDHLYRVDIMDPAAPVNSTSAGVLENVFITGPGSPLILGPSTITADLTPYAGQTIRLRFATAIQYFFFRSGVDNVRLVDTTGDLSYDFNNGSQGWTLTGLWHPSKVCGATLPGHSSPGTLYFGIDASCTFDNGLTVSGTATSPVIVVPTEGAGAVLEFDYLLGNEGQGSFDEAIVQVSNDGGASWIDLDSSNPGNPAFTGNLLVTGPSVGTELQWLPSISYDVSAFAGQSLLIRFAFDSKDDFLNDYEGFHVDDVVVRPVFPDVEALAAFALTPQVYGGLVDVEVDLVNTSTLVGTGTFDVNFYVSSDQILGSDVFIGGTTASLAADDRVAVIVPGLTLPTAPPGPRYLLGCAQNVATEVDLSDNCASSLLDDAYEDNDSLGDAFVLSDLVAGMDRRGQRLSEYRVDATQPAQGPGTAIFGDDDWYQIDVPTGEQELTLDLRFDSGISDIDVEIYNGIGEFITGSFGIGDREFIDITLQDAGIHYVRVYNCCGGGPNLYDFWWTAYPSQFPELSDFEAGAPGWGLDGLWHISSDCAATLAGHSPINSLYMGQDGVCNYDLPPGDTFSAFSIATSPPIQIPAASLGASLNFNTYIQTEGGAPYDRARVLISQDFGFSWDVIDSDRFNGGDIGNIVDFSNDFVTGNWTPTVDSQPCGDSRVFEADTDITLETAFDCIMMIGSRYTHFNSGGGAPVSGFVQFDYKVGQDIPHLFQATAGVEGGVVQLLAQNGPADGTASFPVNAGEQIFFDLTKTAGVGTSAMTVFNFRFIPDNPFWIANSYDISGFVGRTVLLRLEFDTLDPIANTFEGWHVDDLIIDPLLPPDLTVVDLSLSGNSVLQGGTLSLDVVFGNEGDFSSNGMIQAAILLSADPYPTFNDALLPTTVNGGQFSVGVIDPGMTTPMSFTAQFSPTQPVGRYWVGVCVDDTDFEVRNNCRAVGPISVDAAPPSTLLEGEVLFKTGFETGPEN